MKASIKRVPNDNILRNLKNVEMTYHSYGNNNIETHDIKELV